MDSMVSRKLPYWLCVTTFKRVLSEHKYIPHGKWVVITDYRTSLLKFRLLVNLQKRPTGHNYWRDTSCWVCLGVMCLRIQWRWYLKMSLRSRIYSLYETYYDLTAPYLFRSTYWENKCGRINVRWERVNPLKKGNLYENFQSHLFQLTSASRGKTILQDFLVILKQMLQNY